MSDAKAKHDLAKQTNVSSRQLKLREKYKKEGFTDEEAAVAAYKRAKTEKIIAATAAVTLTAAAAYVAYKHYDNTVDRFIKPGTTVQNISRHSDKGVSDAFYVSANARDNMKYRGMYGNQLKSSNPIADIYESKIKADKALKVASPKNATKALQELISEDPDYAKSLDKTIGQFVLGGNPQQATLVTKARESLANGKVDKNVYEAMNLALVDHASADGQKISRDFYAKMKSLGYDAIRDVNDTKYSGYKTKTATIIFNGEGKMSVDKVRKLTEAEIKKSNKIALADLAGQATVESGAKYATIFGVAGAASVAKRSNTNNKIVSDYRKDHPNSKMSYNEIIRAERDQN